MNYRDQIIQLATRKFELDIDGHHGLPHWQRVEVNGLALALHTGADADVVRHFAWLHDACRLDEDADPEHGQRAATWVERLYMDGRIDLPINEMGLLYRAIRDHNKGRTSDDPTIGTCWDADRLDLFRVGVTPAERFFSTDAAKYLLQHKLKELKELA